MKKIKILLLIFMAFVLVFLDISFFSNLAVFGATFLSSLAFLLAFALLNKEKSFIPYMLSMVLFLTIFTSLQPGIILVNFIFLPSLVLYLRKKYFPEPTLVVSVLCFYVFNILFEITVLLFEREMSNNMTMMIVASILINTIGSVFVYWLVRKITNHSLFPEIKLR